MRALFPVIVAAVLLTGCMSRLTGVAGRITFAYPAVVDVANFNKPIAPGARLDLKALELGRGDVEMQIMGAESADSAVLEIVGVEENAVVLQANVIGATRIEVTARDARGRVVVDAVDMLVERPDRFAFEHDCTDGLFAAYPANARISIPFSMTRSSGQPVIGYGFHPIKVTPKAALALDSGSHDQGALHFRSTKARHRVAIRSTIDDSLIGLALVETGDVDGLEAFDRELSPTVVGAETMEFFVPTVAGVPLCQAKLRIVARSRTPEICEATAQLVDDEESNRESVVRIIGREFGICEVEVSYPEAGGGRGVSRLFEVPVGEFPSPESRHSQTSVFTPQNEEEVPWWLAPLFSLVAPLTLLPLVGSRLRRR